MPLSHLKSKANGMKKMIHLTEAEGRRLDPDWRGEGYLSEEEVQQMLDDLNEDYRRDASALCPILAACLAGALIWVLLAVLFV